MWEYRVAGNVEELCKLGKQGWELVAALVVKDQERYVLKKRGGDLQHRFTVEQRRAFFESKSTGSRTTEGSARLLNPHIASLVRRIGHTEMLLLADKGFPVPNLEMVVDVSVFPDVPTIPQVLVALRHEFDFDRMILAQEMREASPSRVKELERMHPDVPLEAMPHDEFKCVAACCKGCIRTGDAAPYSNLILVCG